MHACAEAAGLTRAAGLGGVVLGLGAGQMQGAAAEVGALLQDLLATLVLREVLFHGGAFLTCAGNLAARRLELLHQGATHEMRGAELAWGHRLGREGSGLVEHLAQTVGDVELLHFLLAQVA